ncbi:hypothetical protein LXL04_026059 [Taraxacum kok-saghyz]
MLNPLIEVENGNRIPTFDCSGEVAGEKDGRQPAARAAKAVAGSNPCKQSTGAGKGNGTAKYTEEMRLTGGWSPLDCSVGSRSSRVAGDGSAHRRSLLLPSRRSHADLVPLPAQIVDDFTICNAIEWLYSPNQGMEVLPIKVQHKLAHLQFLQYYQQQNALVGHEQILKHGHSRDMSLPQLGLKNDTPTRKLESTHKTPTNYMEIATSPKDSYL